MWEFFVSHCILRGLRRPLYLFFFHFISPSLPFLPLSLQPETLLPKTSFFPKRQTRLCRNPRIHRRLIIYSVEKNFCWPLESIPGTLSPRASVLSNKPWWIHKSSQQIWYNNLYILRRPKSASSLRVWSSWEFFVSHCILRGLRQSQQICWFSRFLSIFFFLGLIFKARIFFLPFSFFKYFFFKYLI